MAPRLDVPEGASPIGDSSGLIPEGVVTYADLCAVEAENILQAINKHLRQRKNPGRAWFTEEYLRKVHRDMFGDVWKWAGSYRESQCNIGVQPYQIREEIRKLCGDIQYWHSLKEHSMPVLERAVRVHHRLAWIHAFPNGNGRHARMTADIFLHSYGHLLPIWPSSDISAPGDTRAHYLAALRSADGGDFKPLMTYTLRHLPPGA